MKKLLLVIICIASFSETSYAIGYSTGNGWMEICDKDKGFEDICNFYTQGIVEGLQFGLSINHFVGQDGMIKVEKTEGLFCLRERHTREQIILVIKDYMRRNPSTLHHPTPQLIFLALNEVFPVPCNSSR